VRWRRSATRSYSPGWIITRRFKASPDDWPAGQPLFIARDNSNGAAAGGRPADLRPAAPDPAPGRRRSSTSASADRVWPVPPKYAKEDFLKGEYWSLRGPLDVQEERFVALTEVPGAHGPDALFAWAGLTPKERVKMLIELDEKAEASGHPLEARTGLLYAAWFQLPYVKWESEPAEREFRSIITSLVGDAGVTDTLLATWAQAHSKPGKAAKKTAPKAKPKKTPKPEDATP
jgi:hypothetical protein